MNTSEIWYLRLCMGRIKFWCKMFWSIVRLMVGAHWRNCNWLKGVCSMLCFCRFCFTLVKDFCCRVGISWTLCGSLNALWFRCCCSHPCDFSSGVFWSIGSNVVWKSMWFYLFITDCKMEMLFLSSWKCVCVYCFVFFNIYVRKCASSMAEPHGRDSYIRILDVFVCFVK